ncbi:hypothetical protein Tco_0210512 [Tanacetum coccineum]
MAEIMKTISLVPRVDRYIWSLENDGSFSVASIRKTLDDNRFQERVCRNGGSNSVPYQEEKLNEDDGDSNNSNLKENVDESASFGRFKKSVAPTHIQIWIKDNKSETVSIIANLKKELNQLDAVIDKGTGTEVEAEKRMEVLAALRNIDHIHSMDLAQKAKIKWSIEGDENSIFFHGILNKKRNQMNIRGSRLLRLEGAANAVKQEFFLFSVIDSLNLRRACNIDMDFRKLFLEIKSGPRANGLELESTGIFSVASARRRIDEICLPILEKKN